MCLRSRCCSSAIVEPLSLEKRRLRCLEALTDALVAFAVLFDPSSCPSRDQWWPGVFNRAALPRFPPLLFSRRISKQRSRLDLGVPFCYGARHSCRPHPPNASAGHVSGPPLVHQLDQPCPIIYHHVAPHQHPINVGWVRRTFLRKGPPVPLKTTRGPPSVESISTYALRSSILAPQFLLK